MEYLKKLIRKYGGSRVQNLIICFIKFLGMKNRIILFSTKKAKKNSVNINYWSGVKNLGDTISPLIVDYVAMKKGVDIDSRIKDTKHLYAVGSILTAGCQDCTVWGSGILNTKIISRIKNRKLDVRLVRGPLTRLILLENGYKVPEIYGDPAIIMPLIYNPTVPKKYKVSVITHMREREGLQLDKYHSISILTDNYKEFVEEIKASELIVSSSLHGIVFAEIYGVPAILIKPNTDLFKYYDYYYSTERFSFPMAENVEEALNMCPPNIPDFKQMQDNIISTFPTDMWL